MFDPQTIGCGATTRHGEHGTIVGPALSGDRCVFRPDGDPTVVETFTPRVADLDIERDDTSEDLATDHGFDVCPACGDGGVIITAGGYAFCARFRSCWTDGDA